MNLVCPVIDTYNKIKGDNMDTIKFTTHRQSGISETYIRTDRIESITLVKDKRGEVNHFSLKVFGGEIFTGTPTSARQSLDALLNILDTSDAVPVLPTAKKRKLK